MLTLAIQFAVPEMAPEAKKMLASFNFDFLRQTQWKTKCKVWRMKTRVVVNASEEAGREMDGTRNCNSKSKHRSSGQREHA
jgi:hypothetical protein